MDWLVNSVYYVVPFLVLLGILVFVHELGHFIVARLSGVKVSDFSIGFGKKLWGFTDKKGTEWKICAIPLGGYVKMLGDADASSSTDNSASLSEEDKKYAFNFQSPYKKLAISLAGPVANYLFAIFIFTSMFFFFGKFDYPAVVGEVIEGGAAAQAGVMANDKILKVNKKNVKTFEDVRREVEMTRGNVTLELEREGQKVVLNFPLMVLHIEDGSTTNEPKPMLGVRSIKVVEFSPISLNIFESVSEACKETWQITEMTLRGVGQMLTGERGAEDVGGIIRIAEMSGDITKQSGFVDFVVFTALLSINLGLINLFPIPVLDGGHVVIYVLEIITRRELNEKFKEWLFRFGLFLILSLMVFATYNDFARLFNRWFS